MPDRLSSLVYSRDLNFFKNQSRKKVKKVETEKKDLFHKNKLFHFGLENDKYPLNYDPFLALVRILVFIVLWTIFLRIIKKKFLNKYLFF